MLSKFVLEQLLFADRDRRRFTQDSPIYPEVWEAFNVDHDPAVEVLLTPRHSTTASELAREVNERIADRQTRGRMQVSYTSGHVVAAVTLAELVGHVLVLSGWGERLLRDRRQTFRSALQAFSESAPPRPTPKATSPAALSEQLNGKRRLAGERFSDQLVWLARVAGGIAWGRRRTESDILPDDRELAAALAEELWDVGSGGRVRTPVLWSVSRNRTATMALDRSRSAVKADATERVFNFDIEGLAWAVIDAGIDPTHPAFLLPPSRGASHQARPSCIVRSLDFTRLTQLRSDPARAAELAQTPEAVAALASLERDLADGKPIDWASVETLIEVPYGPPAESLNAHGTHVAGIIAGNWTSHDPPLVGICPGLQLYDLRVLDALGEGDEFAILAALSWIRAYNSRTGYQRIHGINLSDSLTHDVRNYACGRTPVCAEVERLHASGVVVVCAAGNQGWTTYEHQGASGGGYRAISITDPGNAEAAITVGATHRSEPHAYGVSYFSSRGPTGDGRRKPDLVAPGEKIVGPVPGGEATSMAAPHVSGAAALLLARHRELIGRPERIKRVLCESATDLQREPDFQGAGLLDTLRALQAL